MRTFAIVSLLSILMAISPASAITVIGPDVAILESISLVRRDVTVEIDHPIAITRLSQVYRNRTPRDLEATFIIPVPKGAHVADLVLTAGGKTIGAETLDADEARRIYESIVRKLRDPALLEYIDDQTLRATVFPVPGHGEIELELTYRQTVVKEGGLYQYRFVPPDREMASSEVPLNFELSMGAGAKAAPLFSPTHEIAISEGAVKIVSYPDPRSEFVLLYGINGKEGGLHLLTHRFSGNDKGTFLMMISPPEQKTDSTVMKKDVAFVLDVSGSMADEGKIVKAKAALRQCLYALNPDDRFQVISFSTGVDKGHQGLVPASDENRETAVRWVADLLPRGGTNIYDALEAAMKSLRARESEDDRAQFIVFMTDGRPTAGKADDLQILNLLGEDVRVFTLGFGFDVNAHLLDSMAEESRALSSYVLPSEDIELKASGLFDSISNPVLTELELNVEGIDIIEMYPRVLPDLFVGHGIIVTGIYKGSGEAAVELAGRAAGGSYRHTETMTFPVSTDDAHRVIRALFAQRKAAFLLDEIRRHGESKELVDEVTMLAKEFRLVTPYTSFLAAPDDEYIRANTVSEGTIHRAGIGMPSEMIQEKAGPGAVRFAQSLGDLRESSHVVQAPRRKAGGLVQSHERVIQGRRFVKQGARWAEQTESRPENVYTIKYLSPGYFDLLRANRGLREILLLGEEVSLRIDNAWVEIRKQGGEELPPALRR